MPRWVRFAGCLAVAAFALCGVAGPASATSNPEAKASQGFDVWNFSSSPIRLESLSNGGDFEQTPQVNELIKPGYSQHYEVTYRFMANTAGSLRYSDLDHKKSWLVQMVVHEFNSWDLHAHGVTGGVSYAVRDRTVELTDPPGTNIIVKGGTAGAQERADVLNNLCSDSNVAECGFSPSSVEQVTEPGIPFGNPVENTTHKSKVDTTITDSKTISSSDLVEVGVSVGFKLKKVLDVSINTKYQHSWSQSKLFSQSVHADVPLGWKVWVELGVPAFRYHGNMTVSLGRTTWRLEDVYWDAVDPDKTPVYLVRDQKMSTAH